MRSPFRRREDGFTEIPAAPQSAGDPSFDRVLELLGPGAVEVACQGDPGRRYARGDSGGARTESPVAEQTRLYARCRDSLWAATKGTAGCPLAGPGGGISSVQRAALGEAFRRDEEAPCSGDFLF